jgi:exopolyphosphatase/pppGpp-phosphohydrolase
VVVPGAVILIEILQKLDIGKAVISHRGLRWGVLYSYFS